MIRRRRQPNTAVTISDRLVALAEAVELADGRLEPGPVTAAADAAKRIEDRLGHGTEHTLVALLGATGSGKSSLANAIVGSDVATTGIRRPTTSSTLACVWGSRPSGPLLDWLEVPNRHLVTDGDNRLDGLVLLDVPDHDSVEVGHRLEMERIAAHADLLVWVTDPEKYADAALHDYLHRLSGYQAVTVLVLNKIDRIDDRPSGRREKSPRDIIAADLTRLAQADGLDRPAVLPVSATDGTGVSELVNALAEAVAARRAALDRASVELATHADELLVAAGGQAPTEVTSRAGERLVADLVDATGIAVVIEAVAAGHLRDASARTGWPFTRWIRRLRPHPLRRLHLDKSSEGRTSVPTAGAAQLMRARAAVRDTADAVTNDLPDPWPGRLRQISTPDAVVLNDRLDEALGSSVRRITAAEPRWWTAVGTLQLGLAFAAIVGALWLAGLAIFSYLQLPPPPTPEVWSTPVPTALLLGGLALGWVLAVLSRQLASIGGRRAAQQACSAAHDAVAEVAEDLVLAPLRAELRQRRRMLELLLEARG